MVAIVQLSLNESKLSLSDGKIISFCINFALRHQSLSMESHVERYDLRPLVGVDGMLQLSGSSVKVNTQTKILLNHCKLKLHSMFKNNKG